MLAIVGVVVIVGALVGIGVTEHKATEQPVKQEISYIQDNSSNS